MNYDAGLRILSLIARFSQLCLGSIRFPYDLAILGEALDKRVNLTICTGFRNTCVHFFSPELVMHPSQPLHTVLCCLYMTHRFFLRLSPCEGLCFSFSLHLSPSESDDSDSEDSLDDDDDDDDEEDEAEEDESDWTPVGSSMCTLSAISAISARSFC